LVDVICDTSFLIHIATRRIKNIDDINTEIGQLQFLVPEAVINELEKLCNNENKKQEILTTLNYIKKLKSIPISGKFVDESIINYVKKNHGIVATMDKELKNKIKQTGGSIISISNDKIVLES